MTKLAIPVFILATAFLSFFCMAQEIRQTDRAYLRLADSLLRNSQVDSAIALYRAFIGRSQAVGQAKAKALVGLGQGFMLKNRADTALQFFVDAVASIEDSPQDTMLLVEAYSGIGIVHARSHQLPLAASYLERALGLLNDQDTMRLKTMINLGGVYLEQKHYDTARELFTDAIGLARKAKLPAMEAVILTNLSNLYISEKAWPLAERYAENSVALRQANNLPVSTITLNNLGYARTQLGKPNEAVDAYQQAMATANANEKAQLLDNLQQAYTAQGDYRSATAALQQLVNLKDSLHELRIVEKVAEINTLYETAAKQRQIAELTAENAAQREKMIYWVIGSVLMVAFIVTVVALRIRQLRTQQALEKSLIRQQLFRAQLNPHFIFNAMESINQFILHHDTESSSAYLTEFSSLMRLILETSDKSYVSLADELDMLRHYLNLQQLGAGQRWHYDISVAPGLDEEAISIPVMLIQPFVENAVVHGVKDLPKGLISIKVRQVQNDLRITVTDNGRGIRHEVKGTPASRRSFGSALVHQQINEYNKTHKHAIRLEIAEADTQAVEFPGTSVSLRIPVFD